jgi:hypothetical protein
VCFILLSQIIFKFNTLKNNSNAKISNNIDSEKEKAPTKVRNKYIRKRDCFLYGGRGGG